MKQRKIGEATKGKRQNKGKSGIGKNGENKKRIKQREGQARQSSNEVARDVSLISLLCAVRASEKVSRRILLGHLGEQEMGCENEEEGRRK